MLEEASAAEPSYDDSLTIERGILFKQVVDELKTLSDDEQEIMILRYVNDLDPRDIAQILDSTANTVFVKINTIVKKLKGKIESIESYVAW